MMFGPPGERFLVLDSDTTLAGPVLGLWSEDGAPFLVDDEKQPDDDKKRLYYDWEKVLQIDPGAGPPEFVFNSGQWFGTAGVLTRDDFERWLAWAMPRKLRHPELFMPGEQGILNYVLNRKVALTGANCVNKSGVATAGSPCAAASYTFSGIPAAKRVGARKTRLLS